MRLLCLFTPKNTRTFATSCPNLLAFRGANNAKSNEQFAAVTEKSSSAMDLDSGQLASARSEILRVFEAGVASVKPEILIDRRVRLLGGDKLVVGDASYAITKSVYLVGFGKAVAGMARSLERLLGGRLKRGIVSVPRRSETRKHFGAESSIVEYREGAENNQPDEASLASTECIVDLANGLGEDDTLVALISGGGSALLFGPRPPLSAERKRELCRRLQNAGASITELNCVRKRLSSVKGGGLAKIAHPARIIALVLSDIVGDPVESIASGPTCPVVGENPQQEAIDILNKYKLYDHLEEEVKKLLSENTKSHMHDKSMIEQGRFKHVENIIIGSNATALQAAEDAAKQLDLQTAILTSAVEGNVKDVSFAYAKLAKLVCCALDKKFSSKEDFVNAVLKQKVDILKITREKLENMFDDLLELGIGKGVLLLAGGEPTVIVEGSGKGGRNQELALQFSLDWLSEIAKDPKLAKYFVLFLSAGTDGQDGPTEAAGAFGHPSVRPKLVRIQEEISAEMRATHNTDQLQDLQCKLKQIEEMLPENVLKRNDSYSFFSRFESGRNLVKTGLTGTNVMDLHFIYVKKRDCDCDIQGASSDEQFSENCDFLFDEAVKD